MKTTNLNLYILFLLIHISFTEIKAQNKYDLEQFFREGGELVKQPVKWNLGNWIAFGGLAAGTYAIMEFDEKVRSEILKDRSYYESLPITLGRIYGEPYTPILVGGYFLIQGSNKANIKNKKVGFEILQAYAYTGILTSITKVLFGRKRPFIAETACEFEPFSDFLNDDYLSFFSGHTSGAFALSTVIAANVNGNGWKILSFVPAFITGFSRIYQNKHWTSDVVMGAAVGYLIGRFVINTHEEKEYEFNSKLVQPEQLFSFTIPLK